MLFWTGDIEKKVISISILGRGGKFIVEGKKKFVQASMISCCEWRRLVGVL